MKKTVVLICYHLGLWGIIGFFATLFLGYVCCAVNLSINLFYTLLLAFAAVAITATTLCVSRGCKKLK